MGTCIGVVPGLLGIVAGSWVAWAGYGTRRTYAAIDGDLYEGQAFVSACKMTQVNSFMGPPSIEPRVTLSYNGPSGGAYALTDVRVPSGGCRRALELPRQTIFMSRTDPHLAMLQGDYQSAVLRAKLGLWGGGLLLVVGLGLVAACALSRGSAPPVEDEPAE